MINLAHCAILDRTLLCYRRNDVKYFSNFSALTLLSQVRWVSYEKCAKHPENVATTSQRYLISLKIRTSKVQKVLAFFARSELVNGTEFFSPTIRSIDSYLHQTRADYKLPVFKLETEYEITWFCIGKRNLSLPVACVLKNRH